MTYLMRNYLMQSQFLQLVNEKDQAVKERKKKHFV